jgi:hypothetical protein
MVQLWLVLGEWAAGKIDDEDWEAIAAAEVLDKMWQRDG